MAQVAPTAKGLWQKYQELDTVPKVAIAVAAYYIGYKLLF